MSFLSKIKKNADTKLSSLVQYEPGNSTKYIVLFQHIDPVQTLPLGIEAGAILMWVQNIPSRPLLVPTLTDYISLDYLMEKTGFGEADAAPLLELVNYMVFGRLPEGESAGTSTEKYPGHFGLN